MNIYLIVFLIWLGTSVFIIICHSETHAFLNKRRAEKKGKIFYFDPCERGYRMIPGNFFKSKQFKRQLDACKKISLNDGS